MARFHLTLAAEDDLVEIGVYTRKNWGEQQQHRYLRQLDESFHLLAARPSLGKAAEVAGYFRYHAGKHVVFYEIDAQEDVLIVRILHESMLPELHLE